MITQFQPITTAFSMLGHYDMILGMNFRKTIQLLLSIGCLCTCLVRNAYTLLDYGDWAGSNSRGAPYIQLMSITNSQQAQQDFIQVRLNGQNTLGDPQWALLPASQEQHSPVSEAEKKRMYQEMILSRWPDIFIGCFILILIIIGICIWKCCCRRGKDGRRGCICCSCCGRCGRRNKKHRSTILDKNIPALPSTIHDHGLEDEKPKAMFIPLEHQGHGQVNQSAPPFDDYGRPCSFSSIAKMPHPPTVYGSEYDESRRSPAPPYPGIHNNPYGTYDDGYSPQTSRVQLLEERQQSFVGGFPPGLEPQAYDAPYGHPPNQGYYAQNHRDYY